MNTFFSIRQIKTEQSFKNRLSHNNRKSNLKSGPSSEKKFKNISLVDERKNLRNLLNEEKKFNKIDKNELSKSQISKKISRLRDRIKNSKKEKTKEKLNKDLQELLNLREETKSKKTGKLKHNFFEIDMSITSITNKNLLRDEEFMRDSLIVYKEFINIKFPDSEIISINGHLDQQNPHCHLNLLYLDDKSITKDLESSYGKNPKNYKKLQLDFNKFVKEHSLIKKYNLKIGNIGDNGKVKYISSAKYKLLQKRARRQANKLIEQHLDKVKSKYSGFFEKDKIIEDLAKSLINQTTKTIEVKLGATYFTKLEKEIVKLTNEKKSIFKDVSEQYEDKFKKVDLEVKVILENLSTKDSEIRILKKRSAKSKNMEEYLEKIGHKEKFEKYLNRPNLIDVKVKQDNSLVKVLKDKDNTNDFNF